MGQTTCTAYQWGFIWAAIMFFPLVPIMKFRMLSWSFESTVWTLFIGCGMYLFFLTCFELDYVKTLDKNLIISSQQSVFYKNKQCIKDETSQLWASYLKISEQTIPVEWQRGCGQYSSLSSLTVHCRYPEEILKCQRDQSKHWTLWVHEATISGVHPLLHMWRKSDTSARVEIRDRRKMGGGRINYILCRRKSYPSIHPLNREWKISPRSETFQEINNWQSVYKQTFH